MRAARRKRSGRLSVDGTSFRRRHRYVTVVSNPETGHVLHVAPGGGARTYSWRSTRTWERSNRAAGESVSMDMWGPYISATLAMMIPDAVMKIAFDRFHVARHLCAARKRVSVRSGNLPSALTLHGSPPSCERMLAPCRSGCGISDLR